MSDHRLTAETQSRPPDEEAWYALLVDWDGAPSLMSYKGQVIVARRIELEAALPHPPGTQLVLCGYGAERPPALITVQEWYAQQGLRRDERQGKWVVATEAPQ